MKRRALDQGSFRLGIQNCKNAIEQALKDVNLFRKNDVKTVCKLFQLKGELHDRRLHGGSFRLLGKVSANGKFN